MQRLCDEMLEKEAQLRTQLVLIHQKDSEIGRLMGELRNYQPQPTGKQVATGYLYNVEC